jgi:hypothetical protein
MSSLHKQAKAFTIRDGAVGAVVLACSDLGSSTIGVTLTTGCDSTNLSTDKTVSSCRQTSSADLSVIIPKSEATASSRTAAAIATGETVVAADAEAEAAGTVPRGDNCVCCCCLSVKDPLPEPRRGGSDKLRNMLPKLDPASVSEGRTELG